MHNARLTMAVLVGLALLAASCASLGEPERVVEVETRMALLEGRVAAVESQSERDTSSGSDSADSVAAIKEDLGLMLDPAVLEASIKAEDTVDVEVIELDLNSTIDLITATVRPVEGSEDDVAWESAKALAPLFTDLGTYAPALDLRVGNTRCICSAQLMKGIAGGTALRAAWTPACAS